VFENKAPEEVFGNPAAPTFEALADRYAAVAAPLVSPPPRRGT
jgi:hypothetical protein